MRRTAPHTFEAKADAEGWLGRRREEVVSGEWQPPVRVERLAALTFDDHATQWLWARALKPGRERGTSTCWVATCCRARSDAHRHHHAARGAHLVVAAAGRQADGSARSYALVNAVMNTAVADEVIYGNPCRIRGAANTPRVREIRPATLEEQT